MTAYLMVGEVLKPQGLHGECKIKPCAADLSLFETWDTLYLSRGGEYAPLPCRVSRIHEGFVYATLGDCKTPEDVERLRGVHLYVDRAHAAPLSPGGNYIADLIGCRAVSENGEEIGVLKDVLQHGPVDIWVFATPKGNLMVPALLSVFPEVDTAKGIIAVCGDRLTEVAVYED